MMNDTLLKMAREWIQQGDEFLPENALSLASFAEKVVRQVAKVADEYPWKSSDTELSVGQVIRREFGLSEATHNQRMESLDDD